MISVRQAYKRFGSVEAVRGVSFDVQEGEVVGILGPNGAGKTTTIRMVTGSIPPNRGSIKVDGLDTIDQTIQVRRRLGYLPESAPLYSEMAVDAYLRYRASLYGVRGKARKKAIETSVDACQLQDVLRRRIGNLSKGYRQRVGLASVLLHDPKVLILDEPTTGLDPAQIAQARGLIRTLAGSRTTLLVSHILPEVEKSCDRIILFAGGRIVADGSPEELVRSMPGAGGYTIEARPQAPGGPGIVQALKGFSGDAKVEITDQDDQWQRCRVLFAPEKGDQRENLARACAEARLLVRELRADQATLEDVYLRLVANVGPSPLAQDSHIAEKTSA